MANSLIRLYIAKRRDWKQMKVPSDFFGLIQYATDNLQCRLVTPNCARDNQEMPQNKIR